LLDRLGSASPECDDISGRHPSRSLCTPLTSGSADALPAVASIDERR
jgi:hypothetical protein